MQRSLMYMHLHCSSIATATQPNLPQDEQWAEATSLMSRLSAQMMCIIWYRMTAMIVLFAAFNNLCTI